MRTLIPRYTDPVSNLTLVIDDDVLRKARIRALEEGTSVNAVVRGMLTTYARRAEAPNVAVTDLLEHARTSTADSGEGGRSWSREDLYDRGTRS